MPYVIDGTIGVDVTKEDSTPEFPLGAEKEFSDGSIWQYVTAGEAISQYLLCRLTDDGNYTATRATTTAVGAVPYALGITEGLTVTSGSYFWILRQGPCTVFAGASCAADVALYTTATSGLVDDTATTLVVGLHLTATVGGSNANTAAFADSKLRCN